MTEEWQCVECGNYNAPESEECLRCGRALGADASENRSFGEASFTPPEWECLKFAPLWVFSAVAEADGRVDEKETAAIGAVVERSQRWTPCFGQFSVTAKVGSGFMIQAALGWEEAGRSPGLRAAPSSVYASSGVRSSSDECGRRSL